SCRINKEAGNTSRSLPNDMTTPTSVSPDLQGTVKQDSNISTPQAIVLRAPVAEDAADLHQLVADCPPLDPNSLYCNLLHCSHFSGTSVAAVRRDEQGKERLVGFISGYIPPGQPDTLFVWQV